MFIMEPIHYQFPDIQYASTSVHWTRKEYCTKSHTDTCHIVSTTEYWFETWFENKFQQAALVWDEMKVYTFLTGPKGII